MRTTPALTGWLLALPALLFTALLLALPLGRTLLEGGVNLSVWQDPYFLGRLGWTLALGGEKYATLEVEIYALTALQLRLSEASALIVGQLVLTLAATWLYTRLTRGGAGVAVGGLPRARGGALAGVLVLGGLTLLVCFGPLLAVVVRGLVGTAGPTGLYWRGVLGDEQTPLLLGNTLRFGALALLGATLLGGLYALGAWLARSRVLEYLNQVQGKLPALIAAYTLLALPLLVRSLLPALRAIPPRLLEAARTLGASPLAAHRTVTLPLTLPALRGGAALALATVLGEFGATLVLTRPEWATLSTGLYERLGRPGERNLGEACALATMLLLLSATAFTVLDGGEGEVT